jgi:hypothetical protein
MMKSLKSLILLFLFISMPLLSQIPGSINYQGYLTDISGTAIGDGLYTLTFRLYDVDDGGSAIWTESKSVEVIDGIFSTKLGDIIPLALPFDQPYWLSIQVEADPEFDPRVELTSSAYSFNSMSTESIKGMAIASTAPTNGQVLKWNGAEWEAAADAAGSSFWGINGNDIYYDQGYVGIGTSAPDQQLSVHTNSGICYVRVSDGTSGPSSGLRMGMSGSGNAYIINDETTKSLSLGTNGLTKLRINEQGYTGINTLSPELMLHLKQDVANRGLRIEHQSTTEYWENGIGLNTKNYKFYYLGVTKADISSVDGAYTTFSDRKLKQDIQNISPVLDKVNQLKPVTFHYIDYKGNGPRSTGFISQDVEKLFPDLVREGDNGYKGLVYDGFAVIAIKAIQEQQKIIEQLQKRIEELENRQ